MEPIAAQLKTYLGTIGFNKKKTQINIKYDNTLVKGKLRRTAHITIEGPLDD